MILTITPNPSLDLALTVPRLLVGEVNRADTMRRDPAGKGVNVARALTANGAEATALFPADPDIGEQIRRLLVAQKIPTETVAIHDSVRTNISILDDVNTTKVNEAGPHFSAAEITALTDAIVQQLDRRPRWAVMAGSLPPGIDPSWCATIGQLARERSVPFAVDMSGAALRAIVDSGTADLIKPNDEELEELTTSSLQTIGDVVTASRSVLHHPESRALVSLGSRGALLIDTEHTWWAGSAPVHAVSTVGAGDSTLAGYLSALDASPAERLRTGVAWGSAAVTLPGTQVPTPQDIHLNRVHVAPEPAPSLSLGDLPL